jgi:hypothetical protein
MVELFPEKIKQKSDEALIKIYLDSNQYQEEFISALINELQNRKIDLTAFTQTKESNEKKYIIIEKEVPGDTIFIILGYVSALAGGLLAIIMGYHYSNTKHKSNSEEKHYVYDKNTRELGTGMLIIGIIAMIYYLTRSLTG